MTTLPLVFAALLALTGALPRLVLVSCDGLRPDVITPEAMPRVAALRARAAYAEGCRNDLPSVTMTNHAGMLSGLRTARHRVVLNFDLPGRFAGRTLLDFAAERGLCGYFAASKTKLRYFAREGGCDTLDIDADPFALAQRVCAALRDERHDVIFLHIREPDSTGHRAGWLSPEYYEQVALIDSALACLIDEAAAINARHGQAADAIEAAAPDRVEAAPDRGANPPGADATSPRPIYLLLTADHGGDGLNHFLDLPQNRTVPWLLAGPDIAAGPLSAPVALIDTTPTLLWLLDGSIPENLDGKAIFDVRTGRDRAEAAGENSVSAASPFDRPAGAGTAFCPLAAAVAIIASAAGWQRFQRAMRCD